MVAEGSGVSVTLTGSAGAAKRSSAEQAVKVIARMQRANKAIPFTKWNLLRFARIASPLGNDMVDERKFIMGV
jgi:hypothetical protein